MGGRVAIIAVVFVFGVGGILSSCASRTEDSAEWYAQQCCQMCAQGYYDDAIRACTWAIKLDPNLGIAYKNRGWAYCEKRQYDLAIADCEKVIELSTDPDLIRETREAISEIKGK